MVVLHFKGTMELVVALCKAMVKMGLSVDLQGHDGLTPYLLAQRMDNSQCAEALVTHGMANPKQADSR